MKRTFSATRKLYRGSQNHYEILGIKVNASSQEIKQKFFELSKQFHPDRNTNADPQRYQQITQAYTVLSDSMERRKFDESLGSAVRKPQGYHSGRSWTGNNNRGEQRRPGTSGYNFNAQARWTAEKAHHFRHSSKLDPLRPQSSKSGPTHFDSEKHAQKHARHDQYREATIRRAAQFSNRPKTAATASMGDMAPSQPHAAGNSFMVKLVGVASAGCGLVYLLLR